MASGPHEQSGLQAALAPAATYRGRSLPLVPASSFGIVLGLGGLANSWRVAHAAWGVPAEIGEIIFILASLTWLIVTGLYIWKWIGATEAALQEVAHPLHSCFIGLAGVATLIIAQGALPHSRAAALALFAAGVVFSLGFGIWRTGLLWQGQRDAETNIPVILLPLVASGFVTAAIAGALGWPDWASLAFGAAFFTWLALESVVLHRLYTARALPPLLRPTLGIQLAPAAVGALAYLAIDPDPTSLIPQALVGYAMLQGLLLLRLSRWIGEQPFAASYWAFTFGVTALPTAVMRIATASPTHSFAVLSLGLFVISNVFMIVMTVRTIWMWTGWVQGTRRGR